MHKKWNPNSNPFSSLDQWEDDLLNRYPVWGIEFLLNMTVMAVISYFIPKEKPFQIKDLHIVEMKGWKYTQSFFAFLVIATLLIYILMGNFNSTWSKITYGHL